MAWSLFEEPKLTPEGLVSARLTLETTNSNCPVMCKSAAGRRCSGASCARGGSQYARICESLIAAFDAAPRVIEAATLELVA